MRIAALIFSFLLLFSNHLIAEDRIATKAASEIPADPAAEMVAGIDRFLLRKWDQARDKRADHWWNKEQFTQNRQHFIKLLGLESSRHDVNEGFLVQRDPIFTSDSFVAHAVRWPVLSYPAPQTANAAAMWGEGIHLSPNKSNQTLVIILPDASELPEHWLPLGMADNSGLAEWRENFATDLARDGSDVVLMATISREEHKHHGTNLSRREYLHRAAFELGRTLTGYEIQMVQAVIDRLGDGKRVVVCGSGEGGMVALMAGAVDERIDATVVGNYFGQHGPLWSEPLSRQIFGLNTRFSDGYIAALVAPALLIPLTDKDYSVQLNGKGGAPAIWESKDRSKFGYELARQEISCIRADIDFPWTILSEQNDVRSALTDRFEEFERSKRSDDHAEIKSVIDKAALKQNAKRRGDRMFDQIDAFNQLLLNESDYERQDYINIGHTRNDLKDGSNKIDTSSVAAYEKSIERFRDDFRENVIGWFDDPRLPLNARSKPAMKGNGWTGHDVMLDVFPDVFAYGVLLMPNEIPKNKKLPVIVCQHGLEGIPQDTITGNHRAYHDYAAKLAEKGYIVFAPQNPYRGKDDFRTLQRKSYPLGKTLFSIIGAQHQQIIRYLKTIPSVDPDRIAFYGLSYGGKSAMRLPALLPEYCLSICSADFNDWVWKNASSRSRYSYIGTGEYEIYEFGLGKTFNYAEMAALIAPRPFMVERGHFDGVAPDDRVAKEFAKVRFLYQARLKMKGQCEIEFFDGPHMINAKGTFEFLEKHLGKPSSNK